MLLLSKSVFGFKFVKTRQRGELINTWFLNLTIFIVEIFIAFVLDLNVLIDFNQNLLVDSNYDLKVCCQYESLNSGLRVIHVLCYLNCLYGVW